MLIVNYKLTRLSETIISKWNKNNDNKFEILNLNGSEYNIPKLLKEKDFIFILFDYEKLSENDFKKLKEIFSNKNSYLIGLIDNYDNLNYKIKTKPNVVLWLEKNNFRTQLKKNIDNIIANPLPTIDETFLYLSYQTAYYYYLDQPDFYMLCYQNICHKYEEWMNTILNFKKGLMNKQEFSDFKHDIKPVLLRLGGLTITNLIDNINNYKEPEIRNSLTIYQKELQTFSEKLNKNSSLN